MPQTLFALAALTILSLFVFQQKRSTMEMQGTMVRSAVSLMSNGIAVERLSQIRSMSFDQATEDTYVDAPGALTSAASFGPGQDAENDDIDDFDGAVKDLYRVVGSDSLGFRVSSFVVYADEEDPSVEAPATARTKYKKVTVEVYSLSVADSDTVRISQTVSCKSACNW